MGSIKEQYRLLAAFTAAMLTAPVVFGKAANDHEPLSVEVFVESAHAPLWQQAIVAHCHPSLSCTVYVIDRIEQFQTQLSEQLPNEPEQAKALVLKRFQKMDLAYSQQLENCAKGLALALKYQLDRYPAIVFAGKTVIYGVHDLKEALQRYHTWWEQSSP
ncbi:TIGR03757 family integrating conjugative element protein [Pseudomaricurvus alkylphenolicus]|uniref:TIGR03757 family integrating conjugative element protein n=1 Tax=Pseudomaricurvus alkylphenolicus TaxID=1306991 RepID=UPI001421B3B7|nr:TIGR03757 family integrating conjugative element protein [Pseudomaricurvus alkylphenolicus]NIB44054.1 TIGR03757 family integrating conjugative element protein [Pseudomaricurvus alkylphenolicus]